MCTSDIYPLHPLWLIQSNKDSEVYVCIPPSVTGDLCFQRINTWCVPSWFLIYVCIRLLIYDTFSWKDFRKINKRWRHEDKQSDILATCRLYVHICPSFLSRSYQQQNWTLRDLRLLKKLTVSHFFFRPETILSPRQIHHKLNGIFWVINNEHKSRNRYYIKKKK